MNSDIRSFTGEYFFLSNFYECSVTFDGITYSNSEAAFQAQKCASPEDRVRFSDLSSSEAKHLGRKINLRKDWEQVKVSLMKEIVEAKFTQHPDLLQKLLDTSPAYLEEGNDWGDRIWGTVNGQGSNLLGNILMQVREKYLTLLKDQSLGR